MACVCDEDVEGLHSRIESHDGGLNNLFISKTFVCVFVYSVPGQRRNIRDKK